jgi:hypothetical protein
VSDGPGSTFCFAYNIIVLYPHVYILYYRHNLYERSYSLFRLADVWLAYLGDDGAPNAGSVYPASLVRSSSSST